MSETLKTITEAYHRSGARIALPRCEAHVLTYLLNHGPSRVIIMATEIRAYAPGSISVALTHLRRLGLAAPTRRGIWGVL